MTDNGHKWEDVGKWDVIEWLDRREGWELHGEINRAGVWSARYSGRGFTALAVYDPAIVISEVSWIEGAKKEHVLEDFVAYMKKWGRGPYESKDYDDEDDESNEGF